MQKIDIERIKLNIKNNWKVLVFSINLGLFFFLGLSLIQPFLYRSDFSVLFIQDNKEAGNAFDSVKNADNMTLYFQKIIKTEDFFNYVMKTDFGISEKDFSDNVLKKRQEWANMTKMNSINNSGILNISVFFNSKNGVDQYSKAIISVLTNDLQNFYANNSNLRIRVLENPVTTNRPVTPRIFLYGIFGIVVGIIGGEIKIFVDLKKKEEIKNRAVAIIENCASIIERSPEM